MAKKKTTTPPLPEGAKMVEPQERVPVTNAERMEALKEQAKNLEASYQKVQGAMELLTAIMEEENAQK